MKFIRRSVQLAEFCCRRRVIGYSPPAGPWFDPETLGHFQQLLSRARLYVEFGSGGSTLLADRLGVETISIESDRFYAATIRSALSEGSRVKVVHVEIGATGPHGYPLLRRPTRARVERWLDYAERPYRMLGASFPDLVLIDGRFRVACALSSLRQAARTGADTAILVDDYFKPNRRAYARIEAFAGAPQGVGASAVFRVSKGALRQCPTGDDIALALADPL